ncbi:hypothetical protein P175DRAFT_0545755 [Aspergillus ochraceoroseus IBT 24754]|uniref:Carboxylic ester hydrolase n=1 Tax=Aspergillus ochraceoroseus IBT 24754 TaxID=1392256 RepID=A0A2T5M0G6_9EURO|nr:uncharacterized protein P175DRAFT_0545755 [Aspergillus ochraceoroseus IBT 24754]PTU22024.1 hypothetical protein P175DRAFT_0545755 [Aspergillus ochraceoroseus IBT 24754]
MECLSRLISGLFAAATVYPGIPDGCFYSSTNQVDAWNSCALGDVISAPTAWGGYKGSRPRMQIYHVA